MKMEIGQLKKNFWSYSKNLKRVANLDDVYKEWANTVNLEASSVSYKVIKAMIDNDVNIAFGNKQAISMTVEELKEYSGGGEGEMDMLSQSPDMINPEVPLGDPALDTDTSSILGDEPLDLSAAIEEEVGTEEEVNLGEGSMNQLTDQPEKINPKLMSSMKL